MRIDIKTARILTSEEARETLLLFRHQGDDPHRILESFLGMFPKKVAEALAELRQLRRRATQKFELGQDMFFTKEQLEQSSSEKVAAWRARRFADAGFQEVWDPCCGIGADSIALARAGLRVHASDKDESAVHFAQANAEVHGIDTIDFEVADAAETIPPEGAVFLDPARRRGSRRIMSPDDWSPDPAAIARLLEGRPGAGLKLSPAVDLQVLLEKFPAPDEIEVISLHGENKETVFWYGACASGAARRASSLPAGETLAGEEEREIEISEVQEYLFDPDPSLTHSGLLGRFAREHGLRALDPQIGYLTSREPLTSPFVDCFEVLAVEALDPRKMKAVLRRLQVGRLLIRKRGITERPRTLEQRFLPRNAGDQELTLLATRIGDRHIGIVGRPVVPDEEDS